MNVVIDEAEEVYDCSAKPGKEAKPRRDLGQSLLRYSFSDGRLIAGGLRREWRTEERRQAKAVLGNRPALTPGRGFGATGRGKGG